jgi:hypothetical protein
MSRLEACVRLFGGRRWRFVLNRGRFSDIYEGYIHMLFVLKIKVKMQTTSATFYARRVPPTQRLWADASLGSRSLPLSVVSP